MYDKVITAIYFYKFSPQFGQLTWSCSDTLQGLGSDFCSDQWQIQPVFWERPNVNKIHFFPCTAIGVM